MRPSAENVIEDVSRRLAEEFGRASAAGRDPLSLAAVADDRAIFSTFVSEKTSASMTGACRRLGEQAGQPVRFIAFGAKVFFKGLQCLCVYVVGENESVIVRLTPYRIGDDRTPEFYDDPTLDGVKLNSAAKVPQNLLEVLRSLHQSQR